MVQVILLEKVENLGQMGEVVNVKPGYARNFLLPRGKALRATNENRSYFEAQKKALIAESDKHKAQAEALAKKIDGLKVAIIRQASEAGSLYGSVTSRDIAEAIAAKGYDVARQHVQLDRSYKLLGLFPIKVVLHPEVSVEVTINIARSEEEAKIQEERGEALIATDSAAQEAEERLQRTAALAAKQTAKAKARQQAEGEGETAEEETAEEA